MDVSCIPESGCCCIFVHLLFFFSNIQILKIFVTLFSGTVRPRRLKLGTHMDIGWMNRVYPNQAAAAYLFLLIFNFSFSPIFKHYYVFVTPFSGTLRPRRLKLGAHMDIGWMNRVYRKFSLTFFSRTTRLKKLKQYKVTNMKNKYNILFLMKSGCTYFFIPLVLPFSVSPVLSLY